jgi:hypothetical protein
VVRNNYLKKEMRRGIQDCKWLPDFGKEAVNQRRRWLVFHRIRNSHRGNKGKFRIHKERR